MHISKNTARLFTISVFTIMGLIILSVATTLWVTQAPKKDNWGHLMEPREIPEAAMNIPIEVQSRIGCRLANPMESPWDKNNGRNNNWAVRTTKVLLMMGLSQEDVDVILAKIGSTIIDDVVSMGNKDGIAYAGRQSYAPTFNTAFIHKGKNILCQDARYIFSDVRRTPAALYKVRDFHIAIFPASGNIARLFPIKGE